MHVKELNLKNYGMTGFYSISVNNSDDSFEQYKMIINSSDSQIYEYDTTAYFSIMVYFLDDQPINLKILKKDIENKKISKRIEKIMKFRTTKN